MRPREWEAQGTGNPDSLESQDLESGRPMEWEARESGRPRDCKAQRVRGPWRGRPREQRASEWEAHQMAEPSRGTVLGNYKV